jgi:hypothetical protein
MATRPLLDPSRRDLRACLLLLFVLIVMTLVPPSSFRYHPREDTLMKKVFRTVQKRGLNRDAAAQQTAGYYEGLLDGAAGVASMGGAGGRGWLDWEFWFGERARRAVEVNPAREARTDFLRYGLPANIDVPDIDERRRIITNDFGMADRQYTLEKAPGARRVALIGDSVSQGIGTEFGNTYEARLERHLNEPASARGGGPIEVLNFSVRGYQLTQFVDVGLHRVPPFDPDVYVVGLTVRSVYRSWADHLASLVRNRVDLKYGFLRQIVQESKVGPNMSEDLINARLSPYRMRVIRWALQELKAQAEREGVPLVVLMIPVADDTEIQMEEFAGVREILDELHITVVDLLETFVDLDDLDPVRVSSGDRHPNDEGHRLLYEALLQKLDQDQRLMATVAGPAVSAAPGAPAGSAPGGQ